MEKAEVRSETEGLLARAVVGLLDLLHLRATDPPAEETTPPDPTSAPAPEATAAPEQAAAEQGTSPPTPDAPPAGAGTDVAAMLTPVVESVGAMTAAVQELLAEIKAGKETQPATEEKPAEEETVTAGAQGVGAPVDETRAEETTPTPEEQPAEAAAETGTTGEEAEGAGEEGDQQNLDKWFQLSINTMQALQKLAGQVEALTSRLAALEGSRGVSVQPTTPTEKGAQHEHRANTANQHSADTIFRDAAHAAGAVEVR